MESQKRQQIAAAKALTALCDAWSADTRVTGVFRNEGVEILEQTDYFSAV